MAINPNLMNVVPLHDKKEKRYNFDNRATSALPIIPQKSIPDLLLTMDSVREPTALRNFGITIYSDYEDYSFVNKYSSTYTASTTSAWPKSLFWNDDNIDINVWGIDYNPFNKRCFINIRSIGDGQFELRFGNTKNNEMANISFVLTEAELTEGGTLEWTDDNDQTVLLSIDEPIDNSTAPLRPTITLYNACTDQRVISQELEIPFTAVPDEYKSTKRQYTMAIVGEPFENGEDIPDGLYYIQMSLVGTNATETYYSDTFRWVSNKEDYVQLLYRRSTPIITTDNYIPFTYYDGGELELSIYIKSELLSPPFNFDATVTESDGHKFIEKLVSYRNDKLSFLCTGHFAEVVRMFWHCDKRRLAYYPQFRFTEIEYVEPPKIEWNTDNILCSVELQLQSDTIIQSNGLAE